MSEYDIQLIILIVLTIRVSKTVGLSQLKILERIILELKNRKVPR